MTPAAPLGWIGIVRLGLVQAAIGAIVMLVTSLLNRVMVVEYALPAAVPAGLVAWHYGVQLTRPLWGHRSDGLGRRSGWILGGMGVLGTGALLAIVSLGLLTEHRLVGGALAVAAFGLIGAGVGAAGTALLALLAGCVAPARAQAAAAISWMMMIAGIAVTAGIAGSLLDPFSFVRLTHVATGVVLAAWTVTILALQGIERRQPIAAPPLSPTRPVSFAVALGQVLADPATRRFTIFVFCSMLAYSMQDLILEPFSGLLFGFTPGESTRLSGAQHGGVLAGMIVAGLLGNAFRGLPQRGWMVAGCLGSGAALAGLAAAAGHAPAWPLVTNIVLLGFANGVFSVSAVGAMIGMAAAEGPTRAGLRLGVWGAAQAIAFGLGGLIGAVAVDVLRPLTGSTREAFVLVFLGEAVLFLITARLAAGLGVRSATIPLRPAGAEA